MNTSTVETANPFAAGRAAIGTLDTTRVEGSIQRVSGLIAEAEGLPLPIGSSCRIICRALAGEPLEAEVIGFRDGRTLLVPYGKLHGVSPGDPVRFDGDRFRVRVGRSLVGRVLDASGRPIDGGAAPACDACVPIDPPPIAPMRRGRVEATLSTGVRAIDTLLTVGRGQRLGIFAGSGIGKSVLLGMLARSSDAPVTVIALVGERGREVRDFVERDLGPSGLERSIVVVATSDEPPVARLRAARVATTIAEWFRDQGEDVLLLFDSITRVAMAQRELGISTSEPPTTRAYPPSVFALLPQLLERTGPGERGSITAFYSVLVEADDINDPIGDAVRGILDGHIWLSRKLANRGHYPAIDILESLSRIMPQVAAPEHLLTARSVVADLARHRDVEDLLQLGAYVRGADPATDRALERLPAIHELLRQTPEQQTPLADSVSALRGIYEPPAPPERPAATGSKLNLPPLPPIRQARGNK